MTDPWSADFDDLRVFSLAMQNKLELSVLSVCLDLQFNFCINVGKKVKSLDKWNTSGRI